MRSRYYNKTFLTLLIIGLIGVLPIEARKVKNNLKVEKESKTKDSGKVLIEGQEVQPDFVLCSFSGYDKEANSNKESFILSNPSQYILTGYEVRIDYLDMQGRMLHSRTIKEPCFIPSGETRRFDLNSWDKQHTYYYYLGNEPRRVATPFQVAFTPLRFWILEESSHN